MGFKIFTFEFILNIRIHLSQVTPFPTTYSGIIRKSGISDNFSTLALVICFVPVEIGLANKNWFVLLF